MAVVILLSMSGGVVAPGSLLSLEYWTGGEDGASRSEVVRNLGLVAAAIAGVGLTVWRSSIADKQAWIANDQRALAERGLITDRFNKAVEHLGDPRFSVRLGGIHALLRLIDEIPGNDKTEQARDVEAILNILNAFVRHPTEPNGPNNLTEATLSETQSLRPDVQTVMTMLGKKGASYRTQVSKGYTLDLSKADLSNVALNDADLSDAVLNGANLSNAKLRKANLEDAKLRKANLEDAKLEGANLKGAVLRNANLKGAAFLRARLDGADLQEVTNLEADSIRRAYLGRAELRKANLEDAPFNGARLEGAKLGKANLKGANLIGANLEGAGLQKTILKGANLGGAILKGAFLSRTCLEAANISGANFTDAKNLKQDRINSAMCDVDNPPELPAGYSPPMNRPSSPNDEISS